MPCNTMKLMYDAKMGALNVFGETSMLGELSDWKNSES